MSNSHRKQHSVLLAFQLSKHPLKPFYGWVVSNYLLPPPNASGNKSKLSVKIAFNFKINLMFTDRTVLRNMIAVS